MKKYFLLLTLFIQCGWLSAQPCNNEFKIERNVINSDSNIEFYIANCPENGSNVERIKVKILNNYSTPKSVTCILYSDSNSEYRYSTKVAADSFSDIQVYNFSNCSRIKILKVEDANKSEKNDLTPTKNNENNKFNNLYINN